AKIAAGFEQMARGDGKVPDANELDALSNMLERTLAVLSHEVLSHEVLGHDVLGHEIGEKYIAQQLVEAGDASPTLIVPADSLEKDLYLAIERRELDIEYQPFVDRAGKQVLGVE